MHKLSISYKTIVIFFLLFPKNLKVLFHIFQKYFLAPILLIFRIYSTRYRTNRQGFFNNHLLHEVPAHSALFEKLKSLFSTKNSQNTCRVLNALNLEELGVKIHNCGLSLDFLALFWLNCTHVLIF